MPNTLPSNLKDFFLNESMREDVKTYLIQFLKDEVVRLAFDEQEVGGAVLAKNTIDKAFENLDILFASKKEVKEIPNEAR